MTLWVVWRHTAPAPANTAPVDNTVSTVAGQHRGVYAYTAVGSTAGIHRGTYSSCGQLDPPLSPPSPLHPHLHTLPHSHSTLCSSPPTGGTGTDMLGVVPLHEHAVDMADGTADRHGQSGTPTCQRHFRLRCVGGGPGGTDGGRRGWDERGGASKWVRTCR